MSLATFALMLLAAPAADEMEMGTVSQTEVKPALHEHPTLLDMLRRNNELRRGVGLGAQRINPELTRAAQNHAQYMARTGSFSHYSNYGPNGRARRFGFGGLVRENIAAGHRSVRNTFVNWRNSGGHWASIVSDAPEVGFGYALSRNGTPYWVAVYGYPTEKDKQSATKLLEHQTVVENAAPAAEQRTATNSTSVQSQPVYNNYQPARRRVFRFFRR